MENYIIEGGIDFWSELAAEDNVAKIEKCLLSNEPLYRNYITLPCGHKFNYKSIYNETIHSKQYLKYNKYPLRSNEIRCPYCRTRHSKLLPWIPNEGVEYNKLACSLTKCIDHKKCEYCYKSGKKKGEMCGCSNAYEGDDGLILCRKHRTNHEKSKKKKQNKIEKNTIENVGQVKQSFLRRNKVNKTEARFLRSVLKKDMQKYLDANNKSYKKNDTKIVLMRTMQIYKLSIDPDIVKNCCQENTIITT